LGYTAFDFHENTEKARSKNTSQRNSVRGVFLLAMSIQQDTEFDLGPEISFTKFPKLITLGEEHYYLVNGKKGYLLLSTICPHQGARVSDEGKAFMCRDHGWRFEHTQGECVNGPRSRMFSFPVTVQDGHLIADLA